MSSIFSKLFGGTSGTPSKRVPTLSPDQSKIQQMLMQALLGNGGQFGNLFGNDPEQINKYFQTSTADPARKQFQQQTLPGLEQRAIGSGLTRSSGLLRQGLEEEVGLEDRLNALLAGQQMGARESAFGRQLQGIQSLLNTPESMIQPGTPGTPGLFERLLPQASSALGGALFGPVGGALGGFLGKQGEKISNRIFER